MVTRGGRKDRKGPIPFDSRTMKWKGYGSHHKPWGTAEKGWKNPDKFGFRVLEGWVQEGPV